MKPKRVTIPLCLILILFFFQPFSHGKSAFPKKHGDSHSGTEVQADAVPGTDNIAQPPSNTSIQQGKPRQALGLHWLHMLDRQRSVDLEDSSVIAFAPKVPADLARMLRFGDDTGEKIGLFGVIWRTVVAICAGFVILTLARRLMGQAKNRFEQAAPPGGDSLGSLWIGILRAVPALGGLSLLTISAIFVFLTIAGDASVQARMSFQLILGILFVSRVSIIVSQIVFAPRETAIRPLPLSDNLAKPLHTAFTTSAAVILSGMLFMSFIRELDAMPQTVSWVAMVLGSFVVAVFCGLVIFLRRPVAASLRESGSAEDDNWFARQFADYWHMGALAYLAIVWFFLIGREITGTSTGKGVFVISLLIGPIFLSLNYAGRLVIEAVVDSLGLGKIPAGDNLSPGENEIDEQAIAANKQVIISKSVTVFRVLLGASLLTWLLSLWGYQIPFAAYAVKAIFQSLVTLALALLVWRFSSAYIERKIAEATPPAQAKEEDSDDEFGGTMVRGRSSTLLPMLRKMIGSILVVMVILTVLSALGVNIGPLLAGAGVVGLAVGFGAQKLVSDILSGFFFLLDDAFRVGEYIQAGSIRGTVEAITLRNVMLRHHLGMLQVVPHSSLGAVTNFMRGGIIIKFPLEFPYDTDIEKVRKTIKKVGQEMLLDEELCDGFIQPLKSQGVYEITNSVMVIRVKFTAKPGKQFVIKREAFRRLTEALSSRGIHYAHRKVIVDFPDDTTKSSLDPEARKKALEAGAVAAVLAMEEEQKKLLLEEEKKKS